MKNKKLKKILTVFLFLIKLPFLLKKMSSIFAPTFEENVRRWFEYNLHNIRDIITYYVERDFMACTGDELRIVFGVNASDYV